MTPRDFCYWLQGYFELTRSENVPSIGVWNTIVEHLTLTVNLQDKSEDSFKSYVDNLWGFLQINGQQAPNNQQWEHIRVTLAGLFEKVTSEPEEPSFDAEVLLERIRENRQEKTTGVLPYPTPICSAESLVPSDDAYCCSSNGFTPDGAWPSPAYDGYVADGQYPPQCNDELGRNPLK